MYKAVITWRDLTNGRLYRAGETYLHQGVSPERVDMLLKRGYITHEQETPVEQPKMAAKSVPEAKANKTPSRTRKSVKTANKAD